MQQRNDPSNIVDDSPMAYQDMTAKPGETPQATDKVKDMAGKAQEKASAVTEKAQDRADAGIDKAAGSLEDAAQKLKDKSATTDGIPAQAGTKVAESMEKTAGYLREHDTSAILDDVEAYVKEHPLQAVAGAVVGGFLISRILR